MRHEEVERIMIEYGPDSHPRILILGAGPAGAIAAAELARKGYASTVLDARVFPGDKICGDALSLDVINQLSGISKDLERLVTDSTKAVASEGVRIGAPGGRTVDIPFIHRGKPSCGYVMPRLDFDEVLVNHMKSHDLVRFHEGLKVSSIERKGKGFLLKTSGGAMEADLILGADGAQSAVARQLSGQTLLPKHHSAGVRQYYQGVEGFNRGFIELYFLPEILPGYLWVFPLSEGRANVGIGMLSDSLRKSGLKLRQLLPEILSNHPQFAERFRNAVPLEEPRGFGLPLGSVKRSISGEGYLLLGDAAGLIDPFSGEGIANAIRSGRVAADFVDRQIRSGKGFSSAQNHYYDAEIWRRVWPELQLSHRLQQLCRYPRLFNTVVAKANRNPVVMEFLTNALAEVSVKRQLTSPGFWWNLLFR